ncbi:MAG: FtsX-like permease family protein [Desulfomonilia bacterium]|nr:FtsX-like permease family protein [Desulfomonilia bacterium]
MTLINIVFQNLIRRKARAIFVLLGLVISIATVVTLISYTRFMTSDISEKMDTYGANILITPQTDILSLSYGGVSLGGVSYAVHELNEEDLIRISSIPDASSIAALGPVTMGAVEINGKVLLMAGMDFSVSRVLKPWWVIDGSMPEENGALIGSDAAALLSLNANDRIMVNGQELLVTGILKPTGSQDDQLLFVHLNTAQNILSKQGSISMVEVAALCNACPVNDMVKQISVVLPGAKVTAIQQVVKSRHEAISQFKSFSLVVSGVIVLVAGLVVVVTMMSSVRERTLEIGILRAIGFRRSHIIRIVMIEALLLSVLAGIIGYITGFGATHLTLIFLEHERSILLSINPFLAFSAVALATTIGLVAGIYPSLQAAQLDPNEALRSL